jgi:protein TonB
MDVKPSKKTDLKASFAAVEKTKFIPAKQRNRNVGVYVVIPIIFRLQGRP